MRITFLLLLLRKQELQENQKSISLGTKVLAFFLVKVDSCSGAFPTILFLLWISSILALPYPLVL